MTMGGMPVRQAVKHALRGTLPLEPCYPYYDLLLGGSDWGHERSSLISKEFGLPVTGVICVTS
ncbi:hypothetical protein CFBP6762_01704 [Xanthomonas arboricola pv. fragariae]|nr:hypothetical protein CFBP6762_01704 [Xanthomonas arboricola pv. fragariae]